MPLITLIHCDHIWVLHNLLKAENVKLEQLNEPAERNEIKCKKKKTSKSR